MSIILNIEKFLKKKEQVGSVLKYFNVFLECHYKVTGYDSKETMAYFKIYKDITM